MKLFLASRAAEPTTLGNLDKFVGGLSGKSVAYIPTAANAHGWETWKEGNSWKAAQTLGVELDVVLLEDYSTSDIVPALEGKDILWFAGGSASYLAYWILRTGLDKTLKEILEKGSVYVGSSAGSMVTSPTMQVAGWYIGEEEKEAHLLPGLNLVDFDIYPHYDDKLHDKIKNLYKGDKLYLLKDGEAITLENGKTTVLGEERIIKNE